MSRSIGSLFKQHPKDCPNRAAKLEDLRKCGCAWSAAYKKWERVLYKAIGRKVDPRSIKDATKALAAYVEGIDALLAAGAPVQFPLPSEKDGAARKVDETDASLTLAAFISVYRVLHVDREGAKLASDSIRYQLGVIERGRLGSWTLAALAADKTHTIQKWLDENAARKKSGNATWNGYLELIATLFNWAIAHGYVARNLMEIEPRPEVHPEHYKQPMDPDAEARLFAACDELDRFDRARTITKATLTQAQVDSIRSRVALGETQRAIAKAFKISEATCSSIVLGKTWNPARRREPSRAAEMRRRLIAAFDAGSRRGEMMLIQIKHVEWKLLTVDGEQGYRIALPPSITKGGKTSGKTEYIYAFGRFRHMLDARRLQLRRQNAAGKWEPNPEGYIFGTEAGHYQAKFDKTVRRLFKMAGLDWGRHKGIVWHLIRHAYITQVWHESRDQELTQRLARHKNFETTKLYMTEKEEDALGVVANMTKRRGGR